MMSLEPLHIKKYPNRRYYDATRSCNVTLQDVYELIVSGRDVVITDSRSNEDITNVVLLQMILERDQPKLDVFPASILHLMIRSHQQVIRQSLDRFFGPFMSILAQSQKQFDDYIRQTMRGPLSVPMNWATSMIQAFVPSREGAAEPPAEPPMEGPEFDSDQAPPDETDDLRRQLEELARRVEELSKSRSRSSSDGANEAPK